MHLQKKRQTAKQVALRVVTQITSQTLTTQTTRNRNPYISSEL